MAATSSPPTFHPKDDRATWKAVLANFENRLGSGLADTSFDKASRALGQFDLTVEGCQIILDRLVARLNAHCIDIFRVALVEQIGIWTLRRDQVRQRTVAPKPVQVPAKESIKAAAGAKGATPLHYAAAIGNLEVVKLLLDRGDFAQLNAPTSLGQTPLHRAIYAKHFEIATELCARGVNLNCWDYNGFTPLHYAVRVNNLALVTTLVEAGAPLHLTSLFGFTVGHQAAYHSDCKILAYFDSIQLDLNRSDNIHQTSPIMVAAFNSNFAGVRFLREHGYSTDGRAHNGTNLGGFALTTKNLALLQYLYQAGIPSIVKGLTIPPLDWAINCGTDLNFCQTLIDQIDPRTDPLTNCGCWCPEKIGRSHRYEPGTCPVLLSRVLNSRAPLKLEVAQLLVTRGLGYVYHPSPNPL